MQPEAEVGCYRVQFNHDKTQLRNKYNCGDSKSMIYLTKHPGPDIHTILTNIFP